MMQFKKLLLTTGLFTTISCGFAKDNDGFKYNLYAEASNKAKVINTINDKNQGEYIRFYTDKDSKWAKYANSHTGEVGWLDLGQIETEKTEVLRVQIIDNLNDRVKYYNQQISALAELKNKINKANYQELQQYQYGHAQGFIKNWKAWLGEDGKIHKKSDSYYL